MGLKNMLNGWVNDHQRQRDKNNVERANNMLTDLMLELQKASSKMKIAADQSLYNIKEGDLSQYLVTVSALESALQDADTLRIHVEEIDKDITLFVSKTVNAIRMDYPTAAKHGMDGIAWGIIKGRADITQDQLQKEEKIVTKRLKMLHVYKTCIDIAEDLDKELRLQYQTKLKLAQQDKNLIEIRRELHSNEMLYDELLCEKNENGQQYPGSRQELKELNALILRQKTAFTSKQSLEEICKEQDFKITTLRGQLEKADNSKVKLSSDYNEDVLDDLNKLAEALTEAEAQAQENMKKLFEADKLLDAVTALSGDSQIIDEANAAAFRIDQELRKQEENAQAAAKKRQEVENQNHSKKQVIQN